MRRNRSGPNKNATARGLNRHSKRSSRSERFTTDDRPGEARVVGILGVARDDGRREVAVTEKTVLLHGPQTTTSTGFRREFGSWRVKQIGTSHCRSILLLA